MVILKIVAFKKPVRVHGKLHFYKKVGTTNIKN